MIASYRIRKFNVLVGLLAGLSICGSVNAASFDCAKASKPFEKLICSNPELDEADGAMGLAYKDAVQSVPLKGFVSLSQRWFVAGYSSCTLDNSGKNQFDKSAVSRCVAVAKARAEELKSYSTSKFYSNAQGKFSQEDLAIVQYVKSGKNMVKMWGNWMPDAYQHKPFPNGVMCDIDAELLPAKGGFRTDSTDDAVLKFTDQSVTISTWIMCSPRTGISEGDYKRIRN